MCMEQLLRILPKRPSAVIVRYGITTALVSAFFLLVLGLQAPGPLIRVFPDVPGYFPRIDHVRSRLRDICIRAKHAFALLISKA